MKPYLIYPTCGSDDVMKNGMTRRGKLSPLLSRMWWAVCRKSELGHPWTPTLWQKLSYLCWSGFGPLVLPSFMGVSQSWLLALCEPLVRCSRTLVPQ
jgi:hypothetical protein